MGCTTSKTEIQLGNTIPWYYMENGEKKDITLEELNRKREVKNIEHSNCNRYFGMVIQINKVKCGNNYVSVVILY